jgi:hypothetical protein
VVDEVFNGLALGQDNALAQFPDAGSGFCRGVFLPRGLALGTPFPQRKRLLYKLVGGAASADGKHGKVGFLVGRQANFHVVNVALPGAEFKDAMISGQ